MLLCRLFATDSTANELGCTGARRRMADGRLGGAATIPHYTDGAGREHRLEVDRAVAPVLDRSTTEVLAANLPRRPRIQPRFMLCQCLKSGQSKHHTPLFAIY